jgi:hypothetical protein
LPLSTVLRRRHLAFVLADDAVGGLDAEFRCFDRIAHPRDEEVLTFSDGSGDDYGLVLTGSDALLWVFDHECPYSPWGHPSEGVDWPGMLDGLPAHLADHLPQPLGPSEPRSLSACYWRSNGHWAMGNPEPAPDADEWGDPQGVRDLIAPVLDGTGEEMTRYMEEYYERPDLTEPAVSLFVAIDQGEPLTVTHFERLGAVDPDTLLGRAREFGILTEWPTGRSRSS